MADDKNNSDEPSIEEILSSIREIISEDDDDDAPVTVAAPEPEPAVETPVVAEPIPVVEKAEDEDVLDLSAFAQEDDTEVVGEEEEHDPLGGIDLGHPADDDIDMVDNVDDILSVIEEDEEDMPEEKSDPFDSIEIEDVDAGTVVDEMPAVMPQPDNFEQDEKDTLINKVAEGATVSAMARLAENISLSRSDDGQTLEDIVRDLLRPMLKYWLDENLPDIIERLVSQELERLAQKAVRK